MKGLKKNLTSPLSLALVSVGLFIGLALLIVALQIPQQLTQNAQTNSVYNLTCSGLKGMCQPAGSCKTDTQVDRGRLDCTSSEPSTCCVPK